MLFGHEGYGIAKSTGAGVAEAIETAVEKLGRGEITGRALVTP